MNLIERLWRRALCYFWLDRLTFQYERGYADGIREAMANHDHYASLTPEELEAVIAPPTSQQDGKFPVHTHNSTNAFAAGNE